MFNSLIVPCRISHITGYGSDFLVPTDEGVGGTTDLGFIGASLEGRHLAVVVGFGCRVTVYNPSNGILIDFPLGIVSSFGCILVNGLCIHLFAAILLRKPALKGIAGFTGSGGQHQLRIICLACSGVGITVHIPSHFIGIGLPNSIQHCIFHNLERCIRLRCIGINAPAQEGVSRAGKLTFSRSK